MSLNPVMVLLNKILAREFYRLNSGFFLLIGTLTFGFMSDVEHKALAQFFVSSHLLVLIPIAVWIVYCMKIISFHYQQLILEENTVLFNIPFLTPIRQLLYTGVCFILQFLPAIVYGLFLLAMAGSFGLYARMAIILTALIVCITISTWIMIRSFRTLHRENKTSFIKKWMDNHYRKPVLQFYTEWLLRREPLLLGGTKIFTGTLIFATCKLYAAEAYDGRLISMAITGCGMANLLIVYQLQNFEQQEIPWIKNLPIPTAQRYLRFVIVVALLLIPEAVILAKHFPAHLDGYALTENVFYLLSVPSLFVGYLHIRSAPLEYYTKWSFWIFIVLILMILFRVPVMVIAISSAITGYLIFRWSYYLFEPYHERPGGPSRPSH